MRRKSSYFCYFPKERQKKKTVTGQDELNQLVLPVAKPSFVCLSNSHHGSSNEISPYVYIGIFVLTLPLHESKINGISGKSKYVRVTSIGNIRGSVC